MKTNKINLLFGEVTPSNVDYKISLNQEDEDNGLYDYLINKICPKNFLKEECDKDKSLVFCEVDDDNKIVLSPKIGDESGEVTTDNYDIIIDSYPLLDSTNDFELRDSINEKTLIFPMQIATGKIRKISVSSAQNGGTLKGGYIGIYANDVPTIIGSKLVFDTISSNAEFDDDGNCRFDGVGKTMPEIKGFWTDSSDVDHQNTFFYVLFFMVQEEEGYKILSRKTEDLKNLESLQTTTFGKVTNFNKEFHNFFDYSVDKDNLKNLNVPYISITMQV